MHPDIEKLINIAKESGELTEKQKEIIMRKAEKLGEDVDEVEMLLETIIHQSPQKKENSARIKMRKCPNCGAMVPAALVNCSECGMVMESEAESSAQNRDYISDIQREFKRIDDRKQRKDENKYVIEHNKHEEKMNVIRSFSVPLTRDAQIMAFNYAKARFDALKGNGSGWAEDESRAWLAKAQEFYRNVATMSNLDGNSQQWLKSNEGILQTKYKSPGTFWIILGLIIMGVIAFFIVKGSGLL